MHIPEFLRQTEKFYGKEEGWCIGDGSIFYICDFFVGSIYTDFFKNPHSWAKQDKKDTILNKYPKFKDYGERFITQSNVKEWFKDRDAI